MIRFTIALILIVIVAAGQAMAQSKPAFVSTKGTSLILNNQPYYFIGTNYWYGSLLGLERDRRRGIGRLRKELDFLKKNGVTNLRLMGGAEGSGLISGITRVGPPFQPEQGKFDETVLDGLDIILAEMGKRDMKAVIFLSNNWEWSGGFQQYLTWNGQVRESMRTRKLEWDEQRDIVAKFYGCAPCKEAYNKQAELLIGRTNKVTSRKYIDDPAIMAWELANEPRPMRPASNEDYLKWISRTAAMIKKLDPNHLVTTGHEGWIGTESMSLFEAVHIDKNIDYLTIHIWAKNWGWFKSDKLAEGFDNSTTKADQYIRDHITVSNGLGKPLVIEEFGLPRDGISFDPASKTTFRDKYYAKILSFVGSGPVAGANFWAFGGTARPVKGQVFWKAGDDYMGDPPMEEQGLNTVFDSDLSTWQVIGSAARSLKRANGKAGER